MVVTPTNFVEFTTAVKHQLFDTTKRIPIEENQNLLVEFLIKFSHEFPELNTIRDGLILHQLFNEQWRKNGTLFKLLELKEFKTYECLEDFDKDKGSNKPFSRRSVEQLIKHGLIEVKTTYDRLTVLDISFTTKASTLLINSNNAARVFKDIYPIVNIYEGKIYPIVNPYTENDVFYSDYNNFIGFNLEQHYKIMELITNCIELGVCFVPIYQFMGGKDKIYEMIINKNLTPIEVKQLNIELLRPQKTS